MADFTDRREFMTAAALAGAGAMVLGLHGVSAAAERYPSIRKAAEAGRDAAIKRIQDWIALPSIAAENRNMKEGADYMANLAREAGFTRPTIVPTDGHPGVFATMDNGAKRRSRSTSCTTSSSSIRPNGPRRRSKRASSTSPGSAASSSAAAPSTRRAPRPRFLAALHAMRAAKVKPPVNLVLVAEGEEEIGSPHFHQIVQRPEDLRRAEEGRGRFHSRRAGRTATAASPSTWAPRASSSWSWSRAAQRGAAVRAATSIPARRPRSTRRSGAWCRRWTRWSRRTATRRRSTAGSRTCARSRRARRS